MGIGRFFFKDGIDEKRILEAIRKAEAGTSGEIRVHLSRERIEGELIACAERKFFELGMAATENRNAVLLYVNPRERKFALYGDQGIHEKVGPEFWQKLASEVSAHIRGQNLTEGLIHAVVTIGRALGEHFPSGQNNPDELSNELTRD